MTDPSSSDTASISASAHISYPAPTPPPAAVLAAPSPPPQVLKDRLYVGNLHPTVDEYTLLQLFSKYGKVSKLDFLFHKSGPARGKPRGYAFVEYALKEDALRALVNIHDRLVRGRRLVVTFAHQAPALDPSRPARRPGTDTSRPTTLSLLKTHNRPERTKDKIAALEAKLRQMEAQKPVQTETEMETEADMQPSIDTLMEEEQTEIETQIQRPIDAERDAEMEITTQIPTPTSSSSSSTPRATPPPLTIFPSSLPSRPLLTTLPTISPSGAQSVMPAMRRAVRGDGRVGGTGFVKAAGSEMNLRAKLSGSAGPSRAPSVTSNRSQSAASSHVSTNTALIPQAQRKSLPSTSSLPTSASTSASGTPIKGKTLTSNHGSGLGSRSGSIPGHSSSLRQKKNSLGIVMKR